MGSPRFVGVVVVLASAGGAVGAVDLTFADARITSVSFGASVQIMYEAELLNIGDMAVDLLGDPGGADDVSVQSFLSDDPAGVLNRVASGGYSAGLFTLDPTVLGPGESALTVFSANSNNLPDPAALGGHGYLVLVIFNVEGEEEIGNNSIVLTIPTPGAVGLVGLAGASLLRRRR